MSCRNAVLGLALALAIPARGADATRPVGDDPRVRQALRLLEAWADASQAYDRIPGVSMAVVHDQTLLWSGGFGFAHPEKKVRATPETMYSICSISKLFTSIAVMQQRDLGKLRLDDPLADHLPWFKIEQAFPGSPPVTVRGVLTHSAGLPREADFPYWTGPQYPFPTREEVIAALSRQKTLYPAEKYFQYSNLGLTLAGELVAATSGEPYGAYVKRHVLEPLGLEDTRTEHRDEFRGGRLATGYTGPRRDGSRQPIGRYEVRGIAPAAGFTSTVGDLGRFASWQFRLLAGDATEVLSANTLREMQRVQWMNPDWKVSWGLGFWIWRSGDKTFVGHAGRCPGHSTDLLLQTDEKIAVVFMANASDVATRSWVQRGYEVVAPAIQKAVESQKEVPKPDATLERYCGRYERFTGGERVVVPWDDGLAMLLLPTDNPMGDDLVKLKPSGEHRFRRIRSDKSLGEEIVFEMAPDGRASRMLWNSNHANRAR